MTVTSGCLLATPVERCTGTRATRVDRRSQQKLQALRTRSHDAPTRVPLYTVDLVGLGRISTMAKPRGANWLPDQVRALSDAGSASASSAEEVTEFDLTTEAEFCRAVGLRYVEMPIEDLSSPALDAIQPELDPS